jgi:mycothiol synthase
MMLNFRLFQSTERDYCASVAINNVNREHNPINVEQEKQADAQRPDYFFQRIAIELDGEIIGMSECGATPWLDEPDQYFWRYAFLPDYMDQGYDGVVYADLLERLQAQNPSKLLVGVRDDKMSQMQFIKSLTGYELVQTELTSVLDVTQFEIGRFDGLMRKMEQKRIQFYSVSELQKQDTHSLHKLWELDWAIVQDVPRASPSKRQPFAEFEKMIATDEAYDPDANFIAIHDGDYIGLTGLSFNVVNPTLAYTQLTGVVRDFRRQGIATAIKAHAIQIAKDRGILQIHTMNNEINPMFKLNQQLGFQRGPAWRYYAKDI